jgi:hypothetical protein
MGKRGVVQLSGPKTAAEHLYVKGFCPKAVLAKGPIKLTISADGTSLGTATLDKAGPFELQFPLPATLVGKYAITITAEVNRTLKPPKDVRELGLPFGVFAIH